MSAKPPTRPDEFDVVDLFRAVSGTGSAAGGVCGIGDDCAVLAIGGGEGESPEHLLVTTDMLVEGVHFRTDWLSPWQVGWKAMAANVSDIAAMGGRPVAAFLALGLAPDQGREELRELREGLLACGRTHGVEILGGDTVATGARPSAPGRVICLTVLGRVPAGSAVLRSTARPGHRLYLGGNVGESAAGLALLAADARARVPPEVRDPLLRAHREPRPQVALGRFLAEHGLASAMIDVSDGVVQDLGHVARESGTGVELWQEALPISEAVYRAAERLGEDPIRWAAAGGEDFVLAFAVPPEHASGLAERVWRERGERISAVGEVTAEPGVRLLHRGAEVKLTSGGYRH